MDKVKLVKWDDKEVASRGWTGGLAEMGEDLGYTVEELESFWWVDDEYDVVSDAKLPEGAEVGEITGFVVIHDRVYPTTVPAVILRRSDTEIVAFVNDYSDFF